MQHCDKILQFLQGCSMLKRSLVLSLFFLVTAHLSAMDDNAELVVVAPAPQKAQQGLLARLLVIVSGSPTAEDSAPTKNYSQGPIAAPKMVYMSPEAEAKKAREEHAREATSKLFFLYPGGPLAPSPEPKKEGQRCTLKISFGSSCFPGSGCCPPHE